MGYERACHILPSLCQGMILLLLDCFIQAFYNERMDMEYYQRNFSTSIKMIM